MTKSFPHTLIIDLLDLQQTKNLCEIYEKLYEGLTGEYHDILLPIMESSKLRPLVIEMNNYFLSREEYEKCFTLHRIIISIPCH